MRVRQLGSSGLQVTDIALGTMTWGRDTDEHEAREQFELYADAGGLLIDTSDIYADGAAQSIVGQLLHDCAADDMLVVSRSGGVRKDNRRFDHSRRHLMRSLEDSLRRLGLDAIDIWSIHGLDRATPLDEVCAAMTDAVAAGKVRYTATTDWPSSHLGYAAANLSQTPGRAAVAAQYEYSLLRRGIEDDISDFAAAQGLGLIVWSPLGRGVLTGKYRRGTPADSRGASAHLRGFVDPYLDVRARQIVDATCAAAEGLSVAPLDVALAWVLSRPAVSSAVVGARTAAQLRGILAGYGTELPTEIAQALDDVSFQPAAYPSPAAGA